MPKRLAALAALSALVLGTLTTLTTPAHAADPAPTDVALAWTDSTHTRIRVTWKDNGEPNLIRGVDTDRPTQLFQVPATAAQGNQIELDATRFPMWTNSQLWVYPRQSDTSTVPSGPGASSPRFDTDGPGLGLITVSRPYADGRLLVHWIVTYPANEYEDPLDLPLSTSTRQAPRTSAPVCCTWKEYPVGPGTRATLLPATPRPYDLEIRTRNEWGSSSSDHVAVGDLVLSHRVAPTSVFATEMLVTGRLEVTYRGSCSTGQVCPVLRAPVNHGVATLQARDRSTAPWYTVYSSWSGTRDGTLGWGPKAPGTRQYRLVAPGQDDVIAINPQRSAIRRAAFGDVTGHATSFTRYLVSGRSGFADDYVLLYDRVDLRVAVAPRVDVRATIQRWSGTGWTNVRWLYLRNGSATYSWTNMSRTTSSWRVVLPPTTYGGRAISATVTPTAVLHYWGT